MEPTYRLWIAGLGLLLALVGPPVSAQPGNLQFQLFDVSDGLSQNNAVGIGQDRFGFLWIGTQDGLNRFDGYEFVRFGPDSDDPRAISHQYINEVLVTRDGTVWAGSRGGLHRFVPEIQAFVNYEPGEGEDRLPDANVTLLYQDAVGALWVGTERGGLTRLDGDRFVGYPQGPVSSGSAGQNHVTAMLQLGEDQYLVGTQDGLYRLDAESRAFTPVELPAASYDSRSITALLRDAEGAIWIGTLGGLFRQSGEDVQVFRSGDDPHRLANDAVNTLFEDAGGNLWIGTRGGISIWSGDGAFVNYRHQAEDTASLAGDDVIAFFQDQTGVIWIGLDGTGINRVDPRGMGFAHLGIGLDHPQGIVYPHVWALWVDSRSELWVGSEDGGVSHYRSDLDRFEHFIARPGEPDALGSNHVNVIHEDDRGMLWLGTDHGLYRFDRDSRRFQAYLHDPENPDTLASNYLYGLLEDRRNYLWVATNSGVDRLDPRRRRFTHFPHDPDDEESLSDSGARSLLEARDGLIWVGTRRGLNRINPLTGRVQRIDLGINGDQALARHWVLSLRQGADESIWVGTTQGLYRIPPDGPLEHLSQKDGLPNEVIYGILIDDDGRLWMSTNRGIALYDPDSKRVESFDTSHGLQAMEFNQGAYFQDASGRMLFGGLNGITAFRPEEVTRDPYPPRVVITDFRLFNRPVPVASPEQPSPLSRHISLIDHLILDHTQSVFTFDFTGLHFSDPERNLYAYRMLGLSDEWIDTSSRRRSATFTALPAGDYTFQVRASNRAGVWSEPAAVDLTILPPPWLTGWAYAGYATVILAIMAILARAQHRRTRQRIATQTAIAQSEERLRLALWGSGDELWDWDIAQGRITRLNRIGSNSRGSDSEQLFDLDEISERCHPEDYPRLRRALEAHLAGEAPYFQETCRIAAQDGGWIWVIERGQVVERDDQGDATRITGTAKDISQLKAAEQALMELNEKLEERVNQRTEALQRTNADLTETVRRLRETQSQLAEAEKMASLGNLVAGVAHEINTPVGVSVTAASHLFEQARRFQARLESEEISPADMAAFHRNCTTCADLILKNLDRAAQLISSFKQVAVDQSSERRRDFMLDTYLREILTSLRPRIDRSGHSVELSCPEGIAMSTYPGALYQVLSNLIINSLTHAFDGIEHGVIQINGVTLGDERVRIVFRDNGTGMTDDVRRQIFEPFFTTRRGTGGSGLGMHIVYNLVTQALHGRILCGEAPGGGALFEIEIPARLDEAEASSNDAA